MAHKVRSPGKTVMENYLLNFSTISCNVGTQKNCLNKMGFFEHLKHVFELMGKKIIAILQFKKSIS